MNVAKTKMMVLGNRSTDCFAVKYGQEKVEQVSKFRYLGITFDSVKSARYAPEDLHVAGTKAYYALKQRCAELNITDPELRCRLFLC